MAVDLQGKWIYLSSMTKLIAYLVPGVLLMIAFTAVKNFVLSPDVTFSTWFVYLSFAFYMLCVLIPCVLYYLRTPPGISHK